MKQEIPPAAIVAAVVVILALVCFFGFKALGHSAPDNPTAPKGMSEDQKAQYEASYRNRPAGSGGGSAGNMQGYQNGSAGSSGNPNH